jgi:hypothetical protein
MNSGILQMGAREMYPFSISVTIYMKSSFDKMNNIVG